MRLPPGTPEPPGVLGIESSDLEDREPSGGRAAERQREFLEKRFPGGGPPSPDETSGEGFPREASPSESSEAEDREPLRDYPDERQREFFEKRFPGGAPPSANETPDERLPQEEASQIEEPLTRDEEVTPAPKRKRKRSQRKPTE